MQTHLHIRIILMENEQKSGLIAALFQSFIIFLNHFRLFEAERVGTRHVWHTRGVCACLCAAAMCAKWRELLVFYSLSLYFIANKVVEVTYDTLKQYNRPDKYKHT